MKGWLDQSAKRCCGTFTRPVAVETVIVRLAAIKILIVQRVRHVVETADRGWQVARVYADFLRERFQTVGDCHP